MTAKRKTSGSPRLRGKVLIVSFRLGKQGLPVQDKSKRFARHLRTNDQEALPILADSVLLDPRGKVDTGVEEKLGMRKFQFAGLRVPESNRHYPASRIQVKQFATIGPPLRLRPSMNRDLALMPELRKRSHVDFPAPRLDGNSDARC